MVVNCSICGNTPAALRRSHLPSEKSAVCRQCFVGSFEREIHEFIVEENLFQRDDVVAIGVSGGKDSAVLLHLLYVLNSRYDYGIHLVMIAVDEGIVGYRDHSLEAVDEQQRKYGLPLRILSYENLYSGWTMDRVVDTIGKRGNCTYCGVFRRQALEKGAFLCSATKLATGHNADDIAETILMNLLRGDLARLQRCVKPLGKGGVDENVPRVKPLFLSYEKEIVLYARYLNLRYFATECLYAPNAYRGHVRTLIKQFERVRPRSILDIIASGKRMALLTTNQGGKTVDSRKEIRGNTEEINAKITTKLFCAKCGNMSSRELCHACALLDQLEAFRLRPKEIFPVVNLKEIKKLKNQDLPAIEDLVTEKKTGAERSEDKKNCGCQNNGY